MADKKVDNPRATHIPKTLLKKVKKSNSSFKLKADTTFYKEGAIQHIFEGNLNTKGKVVGFHYETPNAPGRVIQGTEVQDPKKTGVYQAEVEVYGYGKKTNMGKSTFFPKEWNEDQVISAINEAYKNKVPNPKVTDSFRGESNGVIIDMFIKNGKIESAFPIWPQ